MNDLGALFDERFLGRLDRLSLVVRKRRAGQFRGHRRSTRHGESVEFADYRDYARGDDLRRVDWNIYARLERPFVKLFEEEEDLSVHLLLDASRSMDWGPSPPKAADKWAFARRTAAALGYIALASGDRLAVALLRDTPGETIGPIFGPTRGKGQALGLLRFLAVQSTNGTTDLNHQLLAYSTRSSPGRGRRPGLAILISDLLSPGGYKEGLSALLAQGYEGLVIHTLAPAEVEPALDGAVNLVDVETGHEQAVTIDAAMRATYRRRIAAWQDEINRWCAQRQVAYAPAITDTPFEDLILHHLRQRGLVR
jgi:uncharacterized protein (DUF58 family)